jgi:hypothetical protein
MQKGARAESAFRIADKISRRSRTTCRFQPAIPTAAAASKRVVMSKTFAFMA